MLCFGFWPSEHSAYGSSSLRERSGRSSAGHHLGQPRPPQVCSWAAGLSQTLKSEIQSSHVKPSQVVLPPGITPLHPTHNLAVRHFLILFDRTVDLPLGLEVIFNLNHTQGNDAIISLRRLNGSSLFIFKYNLSLSSKLFLAFGSDFVITEQSSPLPI